MLQQLMWNPNESMYRGQAPNGTVVTVTEEAMAVALKNAGKGVFEPEWWLETLERVLMHWGIASKHWIDEATRVPRVNYSISENAKQIAADDSRFPSGPLSTRILSNKDSGKLPKDPGK